MTENEMLDLIINAQMSGDPLKLQATMMTIKEEFSKMSSRVTELEQEKAVYQDQIETLTHDRDQIQTEKEALAKLYHEKWQQSPIDDKVKDEPDVINEEEVLQDLFK